jgi:excisionase family DNA binding protein
MAAAFEHFVSADVIAEFLGVARETVLALARRGELPAHPLSGDNNRIRKTWRFKLSEVSTYMDGSQ